MPAEVPDCLAQRYEAIDKLIQELETSEYRHDPEINDSAVRLMCEFWNMMKEEQDGHQDNRKNYACGKPDCGSSNYGREYRVFMAQEQGHHDEGCGPPKPGEQCDGPDRENVSFRKHDGGPLNNTLAHLKKAASFDRNCHVKIKKLMEAEKLLREQIATLEAKEKDGVELMMEADAMWNDMEMAYKAKIGASLDRQKDLVNDLAEVDQSAAKWRKNKKELEEQLDSINKVQLEIISKVNDKTNDLKSVEGDVESLKKKIEKSKAETEAIKKAILNMKKESEGRMSKYTAKLTALEKENNEIIKKKETKDKEGKGFVNEARTELQKILKALFQKQLEREDSAAEKNALIEEINLLKDTCQLCQDRCKNKRTEIEQAILDTEQQIADWKLKCKRCNVCIDTEDVRKFCTDCPRCLAHRECLINDDGTCTVDKTEDCVCLMVKRRFLDNVFENMYTVLAKVTDSNIGKEVSQEILECLKRSKNGKLNDKTRKLLQNFILQTLKNKLNLTIIGGAVKTRCELDTNTYNQLMLCLKKVKAVPAPKADKGTDVKKDPCARWSGTTECNCPNGPSKCICTKKAPPAIKDPATCPPETIQEEPGQKIACPEKSDQKCDIECGARSVDKIGKEVASYRPKPCADSSFTYGKNMRAAQCVLGSAPLDLHAPAAPAAPAGRYHSPSPFHIEPYVKPKSYICGKKHANASMQVKSQPKSKHIVEYAVYNVTESDNAISSEWLVGPFDDPPKESVQDCATTPMINYESRSEIKINKSNKVDESKKFSSEHIIRKDDSQKDFLSGKAKIDTKDSLDYYKYKEIELYKRDLENIYNSKNQKIKIIVKTCNGCSSYVKGNVKKTSTGDIAIYTRNLHDIGEFSRKVREHPVLIKKDQYGLYNVLIGFNECPFNAVDAVIKETNSAGNLIVIPQSDKPVLMNKRTDNIAIEFYRCKLIGLKNDVIVPKAILKRSTSLNYILNFDKEFNKQYISIFDSSLHDNNILYCVQIHQSGSEIVINFDERCDKNAVIKRTSSDNIKLCLHPSLMTLMNGNQNVIRDSQRLKENLSHLISESKHKNIAITNKVPCVSKSKSDSHLHETQDLNALSKIKNKFFKTESGQYGVVMDSLTKVINNVTNQIKHFSKPTKATRNDETGEITVVLNSNQSRNGKCESLKITPSGNVYIITDDVSKIKATQSYRKKTYLEQNNIQPDTSPGSVHFIRKNWLPDNKTTSTNRNTSFDRNNKNTISKQNNTGSSLQTYTNRRREQENCLKKDNNSKHQGYVQYAVRNIDNNYFKSESLRTCNRLRCKKNQKYLSDTFNFLSNNPKNTKFKSANSGLSNNNLKELYLNGERKKLNSRKLEHVVNVDSEVTESLDSESVSLLSPICESTSSIVTQNLQAQKKTSNK